MSRQFYEDQILLECIKNASFNEQSQVQAALKGKGVHMPQATLSRRLKKMNIIKVNGVYQVLKQASTEIIIRITQLPPNLLVINTLPGHANSVAYTIDKEFVEEKVCGIAGTIAGDDTIFIAVESTHLKQAYDQIKKLAKH